MARRVTKTNSSTENRKNTRSLTEKQKKMKYEITTIVTMTIGVFLGIGFFTTAGGTWGEGLKGFCFQLLGPFASYLIPFAIIGIGVVFLIKKQKKSYLKIFLGVQGKILIKPYVKML